MDTNNSLRTRYLFACDLAAAAGQRTLRYFRDSHVAVETKADNTPVTLADRETEAFMRERISAEFPEDGIIGEEHGTSEGAGPFRWILDPIDGTRSFICGVPLYGTLVGLQRDGVSVAGIIEIPALGESVRACKSEGAWYCRSGHQPVRARVSSCAALEDAVFLTSGGKAFYSRGAEEAFHTLERCCRVARTWGDCYGYLLVATGRADLMIDPAMSIWDAAAILPVLQEAGGCFTDWRGQATVAAGEGVACNDTLLQQILPILGGD